MAGAEILAAHDMDLDVLLDPGVVLLADVAVIDRVEMLRIAHQIAGGEDRIFRDQRGDVLGRDHAHFQIAALHRLDLGALGEERAVVMDLDVELAGCGGVELLLEDLECLGLPLLRRAGRRDPEGLRIGPAGAREERHREGGSTARENRAAADGLAEDIRHLAVHVSLPLVAVARPCLPGGFPLAGASPFTRMLAPVLELVKGIVDNQQSTSIIPIRHLEWRGSWPVFQQPIAYWWPSQRR